jgi:hypothetical protein
MCRLSLHPAVHGIIRTGKRLFCQLVNKLAPNLPKRIGTSSYPRLAAAAIGARRQDSTYG